MSNLQQMYPYTGLMRYHSAPSSMLASLIDVEDDLVLAEESAPTFTQVEEAEFAQFLDDQFCNLANNSSVVEPIPSAVSANDCDSQLPFLVDGELSTLYNDGKSKLQLIKNESSIFEDAHSGLTASMLSPSPLSSILAQDQTETSLITACDSAPMRIEAYVEMAGESSTSESRYNNSSPAHVLPIVLEENASLLNGRTTHIAGTLAHGISRMDNGVESLFSPPPVAATFNNVKPANRGAHGRDIHALQQPTERNFSGLIRQSSSPAEFLSHLSDDIISPSTRTSVLLSSNSLEKERIGRGANQAVAITVGSQRSNYGQVQNVHVAQSSESTSKCEEALYYARVNSSKLASTEVLCKVSAKRGCATHPHSIAERVRRTKINEGIKKLQELVPEREKLTNTVMMLDEAVEYIKYLQRQVEELSACRQHCSGTCHSEGDIDIKE